jgi:ribosome-associated protein
MDIQGLAVFADYFVICSGTSDRMLQALGDAVEQAVRKTFHLKTRLEGAAQDGWILADCGDVVVHLFSTDRREYYRIEELWSQAKILLHLQ